MCVDRFSGGSDLRRIKPRHIIDCMKAIHGLDIVYTKAHNALVYESELERGTPESC